MGRSGLPLGLDLMKNLYFSQPMDIAILLGDEYGDDTYPNFVLSDGATDFGQGIYHLRPTIFESVAGARLSQFDGTGTNATTLDDDDGNRLTDRWEASIPWSSLGALDPASVSTILVAGVIAGGTSSDRRFLSGNFLGSGATSAPPPDAYDNYGFASVTITPIRLERETDDLDGDHLPNGWESRYFGTLTGAEAAVDSDSDGDINVDEYIAGSDPSSSTSRFAVIAITAPPAVSFPSLTSRVYGLLLTTDLPGGAWEQIQSGVVGSNLTSTLADTNPPPAGVYRISVQLP